MHMECILVSDICIRLWAVIGARREPYCPARCELTFVTTILYCRAKQMMMKLHRLYRIVPSTRTASFRSRFPLFQIQGFGGTLIWW